MARIRSIHPGIWTDPEFVAMSRDARLLFIGIWNESDDQGIFEWKPLALKMRLAPADTVDAGALLAEMELAGRVQRFTANGREFGAVRNFQHYQRPKKPNAVHPITPEAAQFVGSRRAGGALSQVNDATSDEPNHDDGGAVLHHFPTSGEPVPRKLENPPQMEEEGDKGKKKEVCAPYQVEAAPLAPSAPSEPVPQRIKSARGTRLPADWQPTGAYADFARIGGLNPSNVAMNFRDYWHAKSGADATKVDWLATWRTWCRREHNWREPDAAAAQTTLPVAPIDRGSRPSSTMNPATGRPFTEQELTDLAGECGL